MDFYPRPPGGGRHLSGGNCSNLLGDFYPRPPGGGRLDLWEPTAAPEIFLSTPSGWRATTERREAYLRETGFLSTPSGWRATKIPAHLQCPARISIHALRVEGDPQSKVKISIHALRVEGDGLRSSGVTRTKIFLSTPSGWRATGESSSGESSSGISIHALRVEGDSKNGQNFRLFLRKREKNLPL